MNKQERKKKTGTKRQQRVLVCVHAWGGERAGGEVNYNGWEEEVQEVSKKELPRERERECEREKEERERKKRERERETDRE